MKMPTAEWLERRRSTVLSDLKLKVEAEDWHGVADAAMDLREIDAQLAIVPRQSECNHLWRYRAAADDYYCDPCREMKSAAMV